MMIKKIYTAIQEVSPNPKTCQVYTRENVSLCLPNTQLDNNKALSNISNKYFYIGLIFIGNYVVGTSFIFEAFSS